MIEPDDDALLNNKSWAYNNLGLFTLGLEYAEKAIEIEPEDEYDYLNKGNALYGLERYYEAIEYSEYSADAHYDMRNVKYI